MNQDITYGQPKPPCGELGQLRARLVYHDTTGVDRDIEQLIGLLQQRHGYTRDEANAELVRRLSFAA